MSLIINLEPEVEARLRERAAQEGQTAEGLAAALLRHELQNGAGKKPFATAPEEQQEKGETLYDFLKDFIGSVDSSQMTGGEVSHLSENGEEEFAQYLEQKQRQGRL